MSVLCWDNKSLWEGIIDSVLALEMTYLDGVGRFGMVEGRNEAEAVSIGYMKYALERWQGSPLIVWVGTEHK